MRPRKNSSCVFLVLGAALVAGCAAQQRPAPAALTSADVAAKETASRDAAPSPVEAPRGDLVCKVDGPDGTAELYLDWKGSSATGTLRVVAPNGNVTLQQVQAERYKGMIIADDTRSQDLVVHAATLHHHQGKQYMRLGEWRQSWTACQ